MRGWRQALWRGLKPGQYARVAGGFGMEAATHRGGVQQHAIDIDQGSRHQTQGLSLSKDPYVAARYASGSTGELVCVDAARLLLADSTCESQAVSETFLLSLEVASVAGSTEEDRLRALAGSIDFSTDVGAAALRQAGATERAVRFAQADAEWRHGCAIAPGAIVADAEGKVVRPPSYLLCSGDQGAAKASYESTMTPDARDSVADHASMCEGKEAAWRPGPDGPAVRLEWREAAAMSEAATRSMAHMSLTLHDSYTFTAACAVDGSFLPSRLEGGVGKAAWAVWRGVGDDGQPEGEGGALPAGATIADAELTAIDACMAHAERSWTDQAAPPVLLILSDCTAVLQEVESAWRTGSAWLLRGQHRQSLLESISLRRARWVLGGGNVVFQWTPAHRGVYPNHYADVMAKAYLGREVAPPYDDSMQRQGTQVQYGVVLPDGNTGWMAGDRRLLELVKKRLARYALRRAMAEADYAVGALIVRLPELREAWPWRSAWTAVLVETGRSLDGGGSKFKSIGLGAVMRVRACVSAWPWSYRV